MNDSHTEVILNSIADGVFTVNSDWKITFFNRAAEEITGVNRQQAIGQQCFDVFHADICQTACALRQTIKTGKEIIDLRINILNSEGQSIPVSISTAILRDRKGKIIGGVETFRDLSPLEILRKKIRQKYSFADIISKNKDILKIIDILPDIALSNSSVLITGPSGSGKELFAKALHNLSNRKKKRFVAVNCGALPDTLLESELFGYVKGAFTDAKKDKPGRIALAEGGTLFLDEIGDISTALQVKLLRFLQEREYEPLGATTTQKANLRIIAATNKPLFECVQRGTFREDLYYRLNVVKIELPPLADRREDIPLLTKHFIETFKARTGKSISGISEEALAVLMRYNFPGNIRELENIVEHAFVLCKSNIITPACLPDDIINSSTATDTLQKTKNRNNEAHPLKQAEAETILSVLKRYNGNRTKTAAELGIDKSTLWRKMKKYHIQFSKNN